MWLTRWEPHWHFSLNNWTVGYQRVPGWNHIFCFGPVGLEFRKTETHI